MVVTGTRPDPSSCLQMDESLCPGPLSLSLSVPLVGPPPPPSCILPLGLRLLTCVNVVTPHLVFVSGLCLSTVVPCLSVGFVPS